MSLDLDEMIEKLKIEVTPKLITEAENFKKALLKEIEDLSDNTIESGGEVARLLEKAAVYKVKSLTSDSLKDGQQYNEAAKDCVLQLRLLVVSEQIASSNAIADSIQNVALMAWEAFSELAVNVLADTATSVLNSYLDD